LMQRLTKQIMSSNRIFVPAFKKAITNFFA
jgi:hypothetical protein